MHWTVDQLRDYMARRNDGTWTVPKWALSWTIPTDADDSDPGPESVLQGKIEAWCREWGKPFLSFHQTRKVKTVIPAGFPDMVIIMPKARVLFLELKSATGRLSDEQKATRLAFMALGHEIFEIRSFKSFKTILDQISKEG